MSDSQISGAEIMAWRQSIGRPRKWLAEQLGVSPKTIESWEYETRNPGGPATLLLLQLMASCPPDAESNKQS